MSAASGCRCPEGGHYETCPQSALMEVHNAESAGLIKVGSYDLLQAAIVPDDHVLGRIIAQHVEAERDDDPFSMAPHECGPYCGTDIGRRIAAVNG